MKLRIAVQMDHISTLHITGDSTFALMLDAQARGHELFHYETDRLSMRDAHVYADCERVNVDDVEGKHFELGEAKREDLGQMDVVLMRQDPPFHMGYITATHLLERIHSVEKFSSGEGTLVVNDPAEVRNAPEKIFVTKFPDLMPETLISRSRKEIRKFREEFGDIILKPLYGNGGAGVFRIQEGDQNLSSLLEIFEQAWPEPFIAQRYMSEVRKGDKRIILIDGQPVGAINRIPSEDEARSNMHVGGRAEAIGMTDREQEICATIGPELKRRGFIFVGIDVIGDYMTEINVTSPTGIREVKKFGGADIAALFWDAVEEKAGLKLRDFKALTFDCYSTLINRESDMIAGLEPLTLRMANLPDRNAILEAHARHESSQQRYTPSMKYRELLAVVYMRLAEEWGLPVASEECEAYGRTVEQNWLAFEDSAEVLAHLKQHFKLIILSKVDNLSFAGGNRRFGVEFDAIYTAEDIGSYILVDRNFDYLLEKLTGIAKKEILYTGETMFHDHAPANKMA